MKIFHWVGSSNLPRNPDEYALSGVVRAALEIAKAQRDLGHDVTVGAAGGDSWRAEWEGVQLLSLKLYKWAKCSYRGRVYDFRQHVPLIVHTLFHHYDVIHTHLYNYVRGLRVPKKVCHFHADPLDPGSELSTRDWEVVTNHFDGAIAVSQFIATRIRQGIGSSATWPIEVVYNGVRNSGANDKDAHAKEWRRKINIPDDSFVFLYAGAFSRVKGLDILARAFVRIAADLPHIHLVLAGSHKLWDGETGEVLSRDFAEDVQKYLAPLAEMHRVHYLGLVPVSQISYVYALADVLVVPSIWNEACPLVILEALTFNCPVIGSAVGGIPEVVSRDSGMLVRPGDETHLIEAMDLLASSSEIYHAMKQGTNEWSKRFSWETAARQTLHFYDVLS